MAHWSPRSLALRAACLVACLAAAYGASDDHGDDDHGPCHGDDHGDDHGGHHGGEFHHFNVIFFTVIFVIIVWVAGKAATAVGNPALVGEIVAGVILGPHLLDFVPNAAVLKVIGEVGLVLHALEVGLMVDVELLEIIGARGIGVGVFGSALPMGLSWLVARAWGAPPTKAFVVGASMASICTGITLNVLKVGSVLNQPIGQLIIAAATVNEIIQIMLLTCAENLVDGAAVDEYVAPILIMVVLIAVVGFLAVRVVPQLLEREILPRVPQRHRPTVVLGSLFSVAMLLIPACKYSGSSELLGAFLAGLCFCSDHLVHETWDRQVKRVMQWLMRFFFACTIGFSIPITKILHLGTLGKASLLFSTMVGKLAMGLFAQPLDGDHFWILALAWGEWGEMSFFIAAAAFKKKHGDAGIIDENTYNAICLAVVASMVICPAWLRSSLEKYEQRAKYLIAEAIADTADLSGAAHATYFCLQTKSHAHWEQSDHLQTAMTRMGCEIIDYRQWHPNDHFGLAHCVNEMYIRDDALRLPTAMEMTTEETLALTDRIDQLLDAVREALHEDEHQGAEIRVQRWLPGCHVETDEATGDQHLEVNADARQKVQTLTTDTSVYRGADGKLHGKLHGAWKHMTHRSRTASIQIAEPHVVPSESGGADDGASATDDRDLEGFDVASETGSLHGSLRRGERGLPKGHDSSNVLAALGSAARRAFEPTRREKGLESDTLSNALHAEAHHELDGFVHHDAHHPFALPDDDDHEKEDDLLFGSGDRAHHGPGAHRRPSFQRRPSYGEKPKSKSSLPTLNDDRHEQEDWHQHDVEVAGDLGYVQTLVEVDRQHPREPRRPSLRRGRSATSVASDDEATPGSSRRAARRSSRSPADRDSAARPRARRVFSFSRKNSAAAGRAAPGPTPPRRRRRRSRDGPETKEEAAPETKEARAAPPS
ncbi:Sodium/hydrogen exchanger protein [Aureococcus anophagefferens]|uniref:Sodium/hydrogen exchanger protein n=1 Tax=Aureococcus anophagefferens TaxID=44056 RepID=A0ABR1G4Q5_AURAN